MTQAGQNAVLRGCGSSQPGSALCRGAGRRDEALPRSGPGVLSPGPAPSPSPLPPAPASPRRAPEPGPARRLPRTCGAQVIALGARALHLDELVQPLPPGAEQPLGQVLLHQRGHGTRGAAQRRAPAPRAPQPPRGTTAGAALRPRGAAGRGTARMAGTDPAPSRTLPPCGSGALRAQGPAPLPAAPPRR